ncbi:hypothetical protein BUALT_Bualt13G0060000 [Buddleja alternifolia]|uniref:Uncharacterized protein n=1 Tax=Buddleja alternifolia TaxID=168488 RepID=A0AAV6WLW4_9LAMI|nr:hypothetical protein BUALT_Bualt13G0060000 [Buddleja alternifolia]
MGLLDLEGQLTRILVSLVSKDSLMLDGLDDASIEIKEVNVCFEISLAIVSVKFAILVGFLLCTYGWVDALSFVIPVCRLNVVAHLYFFAIHLKHRFVDFLLTLLQDDPMFMMSVEGVLSYDDAACVLRNIFFDAKDPHLSSTTPPILPGRLLGTVGQSQELRCLIAIIRLDRISRES